MNNKKIDNIYCIIKQYSKIPKKIIEKKNIYKKIAGRVISKRNMSNNIFINIQDILGNIQILINKKKIKKIYSLVIKKIKIGDIIYLEGILFKTNTKELTIRCNYIKLLNKSYKHWPDKFHKLKNKESKFRQRYLDLIINTKTKKTFLKRIKIIYLIRKYLNNKKFLEVETPMLHIIPGGATAKPFKTYYNKLNTYMYLRIAPELYLKKLIIGGFTKIFELNRNFRNEGVSTKHNPEFTMIEIYQAYSNYILMMELVEKMFLYIINSLFLKNKNILFKKNKINFNIPYQRITLKESIYKYSKLFKSIKELEDNKKIINIAKKLNINTLNKSIEKIIFKIFQNTVEKKIIQPTFIIDYPANISPLAKEKKKNCNIAERFELFIGGLEIANGFSELNNYKQQKKNFKQQLIEENKNISLLDKDYINALKYGLPPTSGIGIGIDRLVMLITNNNSIKDTILFPILKKN